MGRSHGKLIGSVLRLFALSIDTTNRHPWTLDLSLPMSNPTPTESLPYRDPSVGDLIIRTSDGIDFHVHQRRIADVCPMFADIATLPDPPIRPTSSPGETREKALVHVSETSQVWEKLLPICHVAEEPSLSLEDIQNLLEAGKKYAMAGVTSRMRTALLHPDYLDKKPFAVYALACAGGFEDVARLAARRTLCFPIYPRETPQFSIITARALYCLLDYRERCGVAASLVVNCRTYENHFCFPQWFTYSDYSKVSTCTRGSACNAPNMMDYSFRGLAVSSSWVTYMDRLCEQLKSHPNSSLAESPALLHAVSYSVAKCSACRDSFYRNVMINVVAIKEKLDATIDEVVLVFEN